MRIVVTGWVAGFPLAGFLWHPLSFALGFRELGHEVWFLDESGEYVVGYDPVGNVEDEHFKAGIAFLERELAEVGMADRWVFRNTLHDTFSGMDEQTTRDVLAEADVFVNVSMTCPMRPEYLAIPHRFAIDTDPVFSQVRIARGDHALGPVPQTHTRLFTFGRPPLPAQAHEWVPTRQAVVTGAWPVAPPIAPDAAFTSVTIWQAYPPVLWDGVEYAAKDRSLRAFADLPRRTSVPLAIALGGGGSLGEGQAMLRDAGWRLLDPVSGSSSSQRYRDFIASSAGEIGLAKDGYVAARSGWFSERTCSYLASGRPAVVQDTGWTDWLPEGEGLLSFRTVDEAVVALEEVAGDPQRHAAAARRLVEEHFAAADVCAAILEAGL